MIRTVALGVVCLAGLCAIAAAAKRSTLQRSAEVVFPVVAYNKADRLRLIISRDAPTDAEKVADVAYAPPVVEDIAPSNPSPSQKAASPPPPHLVSRHWHDPHDLKFFEARKQKASSSKLPKKNSDDRAPKQVSDVKQCRSDGLDPLLRKLNLSPPCE